ncbi:MAG: hypothetical protein K9L64_00825 [Candidatus Izimaplasma sp.]|nr:hypothetical protein [Candidatus Izimaplasma bacterium]
MEEKIINLVESYFIDDEKTVNKEVIQEITSNMIERYNELRADGYSKQEAYDKCLEYLGNLKSLSNSYTKIEEHSAKPLSIYFVLTLSIASIFLFFVNTLLSLLIVLASIVIYSIEYRRQCVLFTSHKDNFTAFKFLTAVHKYLVLIWGFVFALIIMETVNVIFSNLDKLSFSLLFQSEPFGIVFLLCLILYIILLIPLTFYNNKIVFQYEKLVGEEVPKFRLPLLFQNKKEIRSYPSYKKISYVILIFLTLLNISITLFSKILRYGLAVDPVTEDIIGWQLIGSQPLWQHILNNHMNFGAFVLVIIGIFIIFFLILTIFIKQIRTNKLFFVLNALWVLGMLIYTFNYELYTGINYDMTASIAYSVSLLLIIGTYFVLSKTWKVLFYGSEK